MVLKFTNTGDPNAPINLLNFPVVLSVFDKTAGLYQANQTLQLPALLPGQDRNIYLNTVTRYKLEATFSAEGAVTQHKEFFIDVTPANPPAATVTTPAATP